jgi:hypothetical protein
MCSRSVLPVVGPMKVDEVFAIWKMVPTCLFMVFMEGNECVRGMESLWTTFFFILTWLMLFGLPFSIVLGCPRLCLDV